MADAPAVQAPITEIPNFYNADGSFKKLRPKDFPRTREGRIANCRFRAAIFTKLAQEWESRATDVLKQDDPAYLRGRRIDKLREQLAKLETEDLANANA